MRLLSLLCIVALQAGIAADIPSDDREVALWVLRKGGRVRVNGANAYTADPFELPGTPIRLVSNRNGALLASVGPSASTPQLWLTRLCEP